MKVLQATDGMKIERDHVYVIPPRVYLSIQSGALHLSVPRERHGARMPLDFFLSSLAEQYGERAVCAILSGTGADGSLGLKAVKEKGGLVIVQDPEGAAFDGMPRNAIRTGVVDLILPVEKIPGALKKYAKGTAVQAQDERRRALAIRSGKFDRRSSISCARERRTISPSTNPARCCAVWSGGWPSRESPDSDRYMELLREDSSELERLAKDLLIHVTSFFRDANAFETLAKTIIPELVRDGTPGQPLRIWIPACSTGEETYSLVMLVLEEIAAAKRNIKLQVFASDVEEEAVRFARNGWYPASIEADVSPARLARFFVKDDNGYRVKPQLREAVIFTVQDILADAPFSRIDLVSCRNLLIYLRPEVQDKVLSLFHFALRPGGILFLGASEKVGNSRALFRAGLGESADLSPSRPQPAGPGRFPDRRRRRYSRPVLRKRSGLWRRGERAWAISPKGCCSRAYAPASVLINSKCEGLHYFGPIDNYLKVPAGDANGDILAMAREGLRHKLRTAILQAGREHARVLVTGAQLRREGRSIAVSIDVRPRRERRRRDASSSASSTSPNGEQAGSRRRKPTPRNSHRSSASSTPRGRSFRAPSATSSFPTRSRRRSTKKPCR